MAKQKSKANTITVRGRQSGDLESWCFAVSHKDYKRITGESSRAKYADRDHAGKPCLYPDGLFHACGIDRREENRHKLLEITLTVKVIEKHARTGE